MLKLILGRAGSGKTAEIMRDICRLVNERQSGIILIVPEQYSHEAERELCGVCGDSLSLYGEVLSFTGLAGRVESELGYSSELLDKGGRLLAMSLAIDAVGPRLKVFSEARRRPEMHKALLDMITELKTAGIDDGAINFAAEESAGALKDKLLDISALYSAYEAIISAGRADPSDRLKNLADSIGKSYVGDGGHIYIDGFIDFTTLEINVIRSLIKKGADITICLTCVSLDERNEIFEQARRTALRLIGIARELGQSSDLRYIGEDSFSSDAMSFLKENLFSYTAQRFEDSEGRVRLYSASGITAECELAAARVLELVRERACRFRDIAVAVRGFEEYLPALQSVFEHYEVPLYVSKKSGILHKTLPAMISSVFEIVSGGWEYDAVFAYLKTGLVGITPSECDILENYVLMWNLRGNAWIRADDWNLHPDGFGVEYDEKANNTIRLINRLRRKAVSPVVKFQEAGKSAQTAREQAAALARLFSDISLPRQLGIRAKKLEQSNRKSMAAEYVQLWDIVKIALRQCVDILGDSLVKQDEFGKLFSLVLSQYDVGTIPISLDRVQAGDMDRMRRRKIKHLIVLGASDDRLPMIREETGVLTPADREAMLELGLEISGTPASELERELNLIYNCLSLPAESITLSYSTFGGKDRNVLRPSAVMNRVATLFEKTITPSSSAELKTYARKPAFELAAQALKETVSPVSKAAEAYFRKFEEDETRLEVLKEAAQMTRGRLSAQTVKEMYGDRLKLSASRIDLFSACRFAYFMQYGLKAKPRKKAVFDPAEMGTFMHFVLEKVAGEVMETDGFKAVSKQKIHELTDKYVNLYISEKLNDFKEKSGRFVYLFRRLANMVRKIVSDMAEELKNSDFEPLDFELDFSGAGELPPLALGEGEDSLYITGIADRIDGWLHDGKLYIRVVDYKTGKKSFDLSDIWYGMGLQMLLYLFTLGKIGKERYGLEIVPAGVMYIPARDVLVKSPGNISDDEIIESRIKDLRRSGLILEDPEVIAAMEKSEKPKYLPVTFNKEGKALGGSLTSLERLGRLSRYIDDTLLNLAAELKNGSIEADPYFRSQQDAACTWCEYADACLFDEERDKRRYLKKLRPEMFWEKLEEGCENE